MGKIRRVSAVSGLARTSSSHSVGSIVAGRACGALKPSISALTGPRICSKPVRATESNGCTRPFASTGRRPNSLTSYALPGPTGRGNADAARYAPNMPVTIQGTRALVVTGRSLLPEELKGDRICAPVRNVVQHGKLLSLADYFGIALCRRNSRASTVSSALRDLKTRCSEPSGSGRTPGSAAGDGPAGFAGEGAVASAAVAASGPPGPGAGRGGDSTAAAATGPPPPPHGVPADNAHTQRAP